MTADAAAIAEDYPLPKRKVRWLGLIFFVFLHVVGIVGTPLYIYYRGITAPELVDCLFERIMLIRIPMIVALVRAGCDVLILGDDVGVRVDLPDRGAAHVPVPARAVTQTGPGNDAPR